MTKIENIFSPDIGQVIACHFSQDHTMVTKILDFIHKHLKKKNPYNV